MNATEVNQYNEDIIKTALSIMESRMKDWSESLKITSGSMAKDYISDYFKLKSADKEHEEFHVMFLNSQHCLIETKMMFRGTVDSASIYPREVAKEALALNASAVILAHNHPSGSTLVSAADKQITDRLKTALDLFDVRVLDHMIVAGENVVSMAERGLL